ncbi:MAG: septation protein SepH [Promicromonosporaceae bacterium]|nr:septation protein SepH [Promicromonosporaceae bacterium]
MGETQPPITGEPEPRLRPAALQARLRAGDTPEQLAGLTDLSLDQIRRFEGPIVAERADAIFRVQHHTVSGTAGKHTIGELVGKRLSARGIDAGLLSWRARREPAAPWLIELRFDDGARSRSARWTFDSARDVVVALDEEARWLSAPEEPETITPITGMKRYSDSSTSDGSELADLPPASGAPHTATPASRRPPFRADRPPVEPGVAGIVPIKRWQSEKIDTVAIPIMHPAFAGGSVPKSPQHPAGRAAGQGVETTADQVPGAPVEPGAEAKERAAPKKKGRSTIPTWDEIVFGSKE